MNNFKISQALQLIRPNAEWILVGDDYASLNWLDKTQEKPTIDEVKKAIDEIEANQKTIEATKAAEKSVLLEKLGITEDEAKLLLS